MCKGRAHGIGESLGLAIPRYFKHLMSRKCLYHQTRRLVQEEPVGLNAAGGQATQAMGL